MTADDEPLDDIDALARRARAWAEHDPDPVTRDLLLRSVGARDADALRDAVARPLAFGTAGLRGQVGPGPARMNRATVIRATRGLAEHVLATATVETRPLVVVGFDARPDSPRFARDAVGVLAAAGCEVAYFPDPVPTPLAAHAARTTGAAAAVVVTASHNPPADNGYKVYGPDASLIVDPDDVEIAARIDAVPAADEVPRAEVGHPAVRTLGEAEARAYVEDLLAARALPPDGGDPTIVYTPLHGVAGALVHRVLGAAGYRRVHDVASQAEPDGRFPTVAFPNPEEPGALDAALAEGARLEADLVLANDPDGDRLAVAVPEAGRHRPLTGNDVGVLLGDHLLAQGSRSRPLVVSTIVSSPMFAQVAAYHGAHHEVTLTGFKWICRAAKELARDRDLQLVLGYEEALGYVVGDVVRDKDGIGAALAVADLARTLEADGETILGRLAELHARHGLWVGVQRSVTLARGGTGVVVAALDRLARRTPADLADVAVTGVVDHRRPRSGQPVWLPPSDLVELRLEGGGRALVRPSGTEPKCKVYVDLREPVEVGARGQRERLQQQALAVAEAALVAAGLS